MSAELYDEADIEALEASIEADDDLDELSKEFINKLY